MKISKKSKLKTEEVIMLFGAMVLSLKQMMEVVATVSLQYSIIMIFLSFGVADVVRSLRVKAVDKWEFIRYVGLSIIFLVGAVAMIPFDEMTCIKVLAFSYGTSLIYSRLISIIKKRRKPFPVIVNVLLIMASTIILLAPFGYEEAGSGDVLLLVSLMMTIQSFVRLIGISMSQIRYDILKHIFVRSMAIEVFLGLLILIISFSLVFKAFEPMINTYTDALWYCFAIVTTIGFGDITAVTTVGRVLTVILGMYGIIVVAVITSVIINFYNETKDAKMSDFEEDDEPGKPVPLPELPKPETSEEETVKAEPTETSQVKEIVDMDGDP